jgi:hypothetical protein
LFGPKVVLVKVGTDELLGVQVCALLQVTVSIGIGGVEVARAGGCRFPSGATGTTAAMQTQQQAHAKRQQEALVGGARAHVVRIGCQIKSETQET